MKKIIVVGGGAAGMMAAYSASLNKNTEVILIERNEKLGKKVFITGKGRCNVTNNCDTNDFFDNVINNPKFLYSSVYGFDARAVMDLLENNGCKLKVERGERVFPVSDHSSDVIRSMENLLINQKVVIRKNTYISDLIIENDDNNNEIIKVCGVVANDKEKIKADAVIIATGGVSYKSTGSDGNGHKLLQKYGLEVTPLYPGLVPLCSNNTICKELQGLSLKNVEVNLVIAGKSIYSGFGEMLFTHFGISGPLILTASSYLNSFYKKENNKNSKSGKKEQKNINPTLHIDLKPALSEEKLDKRILRDFEDNKNKQFKNVIGLFLPGKLAMVFPEICNISSDKLVNDITKEERKEFVHKLKDFEIEISGSRSYEEAIITMGGVNIKEVNPSTMETKKVKNLYLAGELLDVDAVTGGFNLQIAWSTGYLAGSSVI